MSRVLRLPEVCRIVGLSRSSIHRMEAAGQFPKRRRIGERAVAWDADEVEAWITSRLQVDLVCASVPRLAVQP